MKLAEIAAVIDGRLLGDPDIEINRVASLSNADGQSIAFLSNPRYRLEAMASKAAAIIASEGVAADHAHEFSCPLIAVANPLLCITKVVHLLWQAPTREVGISTEAHVHPDADIGANCTIMPFAYVGKAKLGPRTRVFPHAFVDDDVEIGADCEIRPGCVLMNGVRLGDRVLLHPNLVLGADGFGFASDGAQHVKIPQIGNVEIGDDVEIGALCAIDRGSFDATRIGRGSKFDNMVQIGHNVQIGEDVILVSQVGIAGSSTVKDGAVLAGKVGVKDHVTIGRRARIGAYSGIGSDIPDEGAYSGMPAVPHLTWLRNMAQLKRLDQSARTVQALERRVALLEAAKEDTVAKEPQR